MDKPSLCPSQKKTGRDIPRLSSMMNIESSPVEEGDVPLPDCHTQDKPLLKHGSEVNTHSESTPVVIGDHTVVGEGVSLAPRYSCRPVINMIPGMYNYWLAIWRYVTEAPPIAVAWTKDPLPSMGAAFVVQSSVFTNDNVHNCSNSPDVCKTSVMHSVAAKSNWTFTRMMFTSPALDTILDNTTLAPYMNGTHINCDAVADGLALPLQINRANMLSLSNLLLEGRTRWDNTALYAKALHYILGYELLLHYSELNDNLLVADFPPFVDTQFEWIDLTASPFPLDAIENATHPTTLVLNEDWDYFPDYLNFVYILSSDGPFYMPGVRNEMPPGIAFTFPPIPITVLGRGPAPSAPFNGPVDIEVFLVFLHQLARKRGEEDFYAAGLQVATFLLGSDSAFIHEGIPPTEPLDLVTRKGIISAYTIPRGREAEKFIGSVTPTFEHASALQITRPHDYNWIHRLLGMKRHCSVQMFEDCQEFLQLEKQIQFKCIALSAAFISHATTTCLYTLSITGIDLQLFRAHDPFQSQLLLYLLDFNRWLTKSNEEPPAYLCHVRELLGSWCGATLSKNFSADRDWSNWRDVDSWPEGPWKISWPYSTPRRGSLFSINRWLIERPIEWGVVRPVASVDFTQEVVTSHIAARRGWMSYRGAAQEYRSAASKKPGIFVPYGIHGYNAIRQIGRLSDPEGLIQPSFQPIPFRLRSQPNLRPPIPLPEYIPVEHLANARVLEPCSLKTFDWTFHTVWCICISQGQYPAGFLDFLRTINVNDCPLVGVSLDPLFNMQEELHNNHN